ncbi:hypothetical protein [Chryseobacterium chendengshani]|uniref:hypothetical protein n=1 Tax=Chryseobacterium sp. LJ756 TaxID=2864113 RepID=UPI001C6408D0|nr:hypothetical protein [Chryseobacterium sp. LJ756]MBW7675407.1 hypothetical protein [Chryseobacterium sp. LJ756]
MKKLEKLKSKKILSKNTIKGGAGIYQDFEPTTNHRPSYCSVNNGHVSCDHSTDNLFPNGDIGGSFPQDPC